VDGLNDAPAASSSPASPIVAIRFLGGYPERRVDRGRGRHVAGEQGGVEHDPEGPEGLAVPLWPETDQGDVAIPTLVGQGRWSRRIL